MIVRRRELKSSYFVLSISSGLADITFMASKFISVTLAQQFYAEFALAHELVRVAPMKQHAQK